MGLTRPNYKMMEPSILTSVVPYQGTVKVSREPLELCVLIEKLQTNFAVMHRSHEDVGDHFLYKSIERTIYRPYLSIQVTKTSIVLTPKLYYFEPV